MGQATGRPAGDLISLSSHTDTQFLRGSRKRPVIFSEAELLVVMFDLVDEGHYRGDAAKCLERRLKPAGPSNRRFPFLHGSKGRGFPFLHAVSCRRGKHVEVADAEST